MTKREKDDLTQERLKELLSYDPDSGVFVWRVSTNGRVKAGDVAGKTLNGYRKIKVDGFDRMAHRLAWLYVHGKWPRQYIDHINGNPSDNRIVNLREASPAINRQNLRAASASSGLLGVHMQRGKWAARIRVDGKLITIGRFKDPNEAHREYLVAKRRLHAGCTI